MLCYPGDDTMMIARVAEEEVITSAPQIQLVYVSASMDGQMTGRPDRSPYIPIYSMYHSIYNSFNKVCNLTPAELINPNEANYTSVAKVITESASQKH